MRSVLRRWSRFGRFNAVGLLGAGLQIGLVWLFTERLHVPVLRATPLAVELVLLHNFLWHERFTWNDRRFGSMRQRAGALWRFHAGNGLVSVLGNTVMLYCLVGQLKLPVIPSAAAAIVFCSAVNFVLADRWVYAR